MRSRFVLVLLAAIAFAGCEGKDVGNRELGALGGGALGAGLGAIIGHQTGNAGAGIAIGAAAGALGGGLVGNSLDNTNDRLSDSDRRIAEQDRQLAENRRLIDELRSRGVDVHDSDRGVVMNLPDVLFRFNSASLTPEAERTVGQISEVLQRSQGRRISVEGHTDSIGTISYNQRLSEDRANSVARELTSAGVPRSRVTTRGFGESDPIASNKTEAGRKRNRRVEVILENR